MKNKLIFTSYGLTTKEGQKLIGKELGSYEFIILSGHQMSNQEVLECDIYYCGEGNTFEELSILRERGLDSIIKEGFKTGNKIYIGCSAGAAIAGVSVEEIKDFDKNNVILATAMGLKINTKVFFQYQTKRVW